MGRRGPRPQPTAIKKAKGNPGKRKLNQDEPEPKALTKSPAAPSTLPAVGKKIWNRHARELFELGVLTALDLQRFEDYCWAQARVMEIRRKLKTLPTEFQERWQRLLLAQTDQARKLGDDFGLSPASRSTIKATPKGKATDPKARFFGKKKQGLKLVK